MLNLCEFMFDRKGTPRWFANLLEYSQNPKLKILNSPENSFKNVWRWSAFSNLCSIIPWLLERWCCYRKYVTILREYHLISVRIQSFKLVSWLENLLQPVELSFSLLQQKHEKSEFRMLIKYYFLRGKSIKETEDKETAQRSSIESASD